MCIRRIPRRRRGRGPPGKPGSTSRSLDSLHARHAGRRDARTQKRPWQSERHRPRRHEAAALGLPGNRSGHRNETAIVELLCRAKADSGGGKSDRRADASLHHCGEWMALPETAAVLLEHGADLNAIAPGSNMTPLDYAIPCGRHPMIAFLTERGAKRAPGRDDRPRGSSCSSSATAKRKRPGGSSRRIPN